jgi:hypothetical protein
LHSGNTSHRKVLYVSSRDTNTGCFKNIRTIVVVVVAVVFERLYDGELIFNILLIHNLICYLFSASGAI